MQFITIIVQFNRWKQEELIKINERKAKEKFEKLETSKKFSEEILEKRRLVRK